MRCDGRRFEKMRTVKITKDYIKYAEGSCLIEAGNTKVICTASVEETVPPFLKNTGTGWVTGEYGMLPRSSAVRILRESLRGKVSGRTFEIQRLIGRSLRAVADLSKLGERTIIIDADVIQADGGTRCASITGGFVALAFAEKWLKKKKIIKENILKGYVAAVSVGILKGEILLDLNYEEDSHAEVDMNVIMTDTGKLIEVQAAAEKGVFSRNQMNSLIDLAEGGIKELIDIQQKTVET